VRGAETVRVDEVECVLLDLVVDEGDPQGRSRASGEHGPQSADDHRCRQAALKLTHSGLPEHLKTLALAGDVEAARIASDAIGRLLGSRATEARVLDLATVRRRRHE
jgi:hypothetical protein